MAAFSSRPGVPGRQGLAQRPRPGHGDPAGPQRRRPLDPPHMPAGEGQRVVDGHHQVVAEAGIEAADLDLPPLGQQPQAHPPGLAGELEPDHHPPVREQVAAEERLRPGPQHDVGVGVLAVHLRPALGPAADGLQHPGQVLAGRRRLVDRPAPVRLGADLQHPGPLQLAQAPGQQRPRQPGRAGGDLVEGPAAEQQVAQDDRRPALGEDLRPPRDRAELAVVAHGPVSPAVVAPPSSNREPAGPARPRRVHKLS